MGSNLGFTRIYGRAEPGKRVVEDVPKNRGENVSTIGAIGLDGIRAAMSVPKAIDGETMVFFADREFLVESEVYFAFSQASNARRTIVCIRRSVCFYHAARYLAYA